MHSSHFECRCLSVPSIRSALLLPHKFHVRVNQLDLQRLRHGQRPTAVAGILNEHLKKLMHSGKGWKHQCRDSYTVRLGLEKAD